MKKIMFVCSALLLLLAACSSTTKPEEVVMAQQEPWNAGDVAAALELYTDDVVVKIEPALPPGSPDQHSGKVELRAWFEELAAMNFELEIEVLQVDGNTVTTKTKTWVDATRDLGVAPLVAIEVYTVDDGKIKAWTWTLSDESLTEVQAAIAALPPPPDAEELVVQVVFDGEACTYFGPATVRAGTQVTFEFEATAKPDKIAMVVGRVKEGTTWEEMVEYVETHPAAGNVPAYAEPMGFQVLDGPGSLDLELEDSDYGIQCATAPDDTNTRYLAALIKVTEA